MPSTLPHPPQTAWVLPAIPAASPLPLLPTLVPRQPALLPRFAVYYAQLRALPRRVRRALQRQGRLSLAGVAMLLALGMQPGLAATIPVSATCTLVDAITAANTDTATGGCPTGSGADTVVLPVDSIQTLVSVDNSIYRPTGLPVIRSSLTIAGQGSTIVRESGAPEFRIFAVDLTGALTLRETTVSGGKLPAPSSYDPLNNGGGVFNYRGTVTITNSTISGNVIGFGSGGGVGNTGGTLTITNSTIADNYAGFTGGAVRNDGGMLTIVNSTITGNQTEGGGGGVVNVDGTVTLTNSTIASNSAFGLGGGVANVDGTITITDSTITNNESYYAGGGGGVFNVDGTVTLTDSTIADNFANDGGGVLNIEGTVTLTNSTITGNGAGTYGGSGTGGGIVNARGILTITNSTIADNRAQAYGGGVFNYSGTIAVTNSTIAGNRARSGGGIDNRGTLTLATSTVTNNAVFRLTGGGLHNTDTLTLTHTIVAGNFPGGGPHADCHPDGGTLTSAGHNLVGTDTGCPRDGVGDQSVALADVFTRVLGPLRDNGGPTATHALRPGSPALDTGAPQCTDSSGVPLLTDQRGAARPQGAACDIGAVEGAVAGATLIVTTVADEVELSNEELSLREALAVAQAGDTVSFAEELAGAALFLDPNRGQLTIAQSVNIMGPEPGGVMLWGTGSSRVVEVRPALVVLSGVTISGGIDRVGEPSFKAGGGGIRNAGTLILLHSTVSGNQTVGSGGGIHNDGYSGTLTLLQSTVSGNSARDSGGGIGGGMVALSHSTVSENSAGSNGGGIQSATLFLTHSTVSGNSAHTGGGIDNDTFGTLLTHSTMSGNLARENGGGIHNGVVGTIVNSTISGNQANGNGGGISFGFRELTLRSSTISGNHAGVGGGGIAMLYDDTTVTLTHTIVAGNTAADEGIADCRPNAGTLTSEGHNLVGAGTGCPSNGVGDQNVALADVFTRVLGPLQENGGPTETHAVLLGSPAVNAGVPQCTDPSGTPLRTDQRGVLRPQGGACDIGAVEFLPALICGGQLATLVGSAQDDVLTGTAGDDIIHGLDGHDTLQGLGGNDILCGGVGNDRLRGGLGEDMLLGGVGNDTLAGEEGNDSLHGGSGTDVCDGGTGTDTAVGGCEETRNLP